MRTFLRDPGYVIGFVVLLAAIYVGAYNATVSHGLYVVPLVPLKFDSGAMRVFAKGTLVDEEPEYSISGAWVAAFFTPIHIIDRRIRPTFWRHS